MTNTFLQHPFYCSRNLDYLRKLNVMLMRSKMADLLSQSHLDDIPLNDIVLDDNISIEIPTASIQVPIASEEDTEFKLYDVSADTMSDINCINLTLMTYFRNRGLLKRAKRKKNVMTGAGAMKLEYFVWHRL